MLQKYFINIFIIFYIIASLINKCEADNFCKFPPATKTIPQDTTIPVSGTKDFGNVRYVATTKLRSECSVDACAKAPSLIEVEDGGHVKNVIIGDGAKGILCKGGCILENVFFEKTCYHAVDLGNSMDATPKTYTIIGGAVTNAIDKVFTQAGAGQTIISNFCAQNFSKVWRSCGMECNQHTRSVNITNSKFMGPGLSIISLNTNYHDTMSVSNIQIDGQICFGCQEYKGIEGSANSITPQAQCKPTEECQKTSCKYSQSAFKIGGDYQDCISGLQRSGKK
uniref:Probable pectate lyase F n=1 Tax=Meloidogyne enterolobii TaxID=390850 RepID=A0A6V7TVQ9_MELEN|nr:unnamed protein product [Meloidogyne enterolobii]